MIDPAMDWGGLKDSENAPNSFFPKINRTLFWRFGTDMESNHTLHGSELGPHWVLGPKNSKFGPMGPKKFAQKFVYAKLIRYHKVILWSFMPK